MVAPQLLLPDLQAPAAERLDLGVPAHFIVQDRQAVQALRDVEVVAPQLLLRDLQAPAAERLGLGVPAHFIVQDRQVVQAVRHVGVVAPQLLLHDLQAPAEQRLGLGVPAQVHVQGRQVVHQSGRDFFLSAEVPPGQVHGLLVFSRRLGQLPLLLERFGPFIKGHYLPLGRIGLVLRRWDDQGRQRQRRHDPTSNHPEHGEAPSEVWRMLVPRDSCRASWADRSS